MAELDAMLDLALDLTDRAGRLTLGYFRGGTRPEWKADATPVTVADREAETLIRHELERVHPDHAVVGEEFGVQDGTAPYRWWIDPIDGTKAFVRGVPLYGVLIGVEREGVPVLGVAAFPALGETIAAAHGRGCRLNGRRCYVSDTSDLARAAASTTDAGAFAAAGRRAAWDRLTAATWIRAGWGDAYGYALVASGRIEIMADPALHPWDAAPFPVLLSEAGGWFGDWAGRVTMHGGEGLATNAALRAPVLRLLANEDRDTVPGEDADRLGA
ncbi:MAG: inositol monophosphatase family protein [Trueperaceae bacterium]